MSSQDLLMILVKIFNDTLDMNMTSIYVKTVCIEIGFTGKLFYKLSEILYFNWYFLINEFKVKSSHTTKHLRCVYKRRQWQQLLPGASLGTTQYGYLAT